MHAFFGRINSIQNGWETLPFPTVAAVHGLCLAGGLEFALMCDMIWASESTRFGLVEAMAGTIPFGGGIQRLVERAGSARAKEIVMEGGLFDAETFERWNIINRILPDDRLAVKSLNYVKRLANGPTVAHAATKRVVAEYLNHGIQAADQIIPNLGSRLFETEDLKYGVDTTIANGPGRRKFSGR